jgi:hypothetical protein
MRLRLIYSSSRFGAFDSYEIFPLTGIAFFINNRSYLVESGSLEVSLSVILCGTLFPNWSLVSLISPGTATIRGSVVVSTLVSGVLGRKFAPVQKLLISRKSTTVFSGLSYKNKTLKS